MADSIIVALISGSVTLFGTIVTVLITANKQQATMETKLAVIDERIVTLKSSVDKHNNFAGRIPVIEEKINSMDQRITKLEKGVGQ